MHATTYYLTPFPTSVMGRTFTCHYVLCNTGLSLKRAMRHIVSLNMANSGAELRVAY
jgi:hypothetical protein